MPITVNCACGKQYPVKEEFAGHRVKCPGCGQVLTVPSGEANGRTMLAMSTGSVSTPNDLQLDEVDEVDGGAVVQSVPKKKRGKGLLFTLLGCGCLSVLFVMGLGAAGGVAWYSGALDGLGDSFASTTDSDKDKDKEKDKAVDPNKDKAIDPNKDKTVDPNKDKAVDPNKDKSVDPNKDKAPPDKPLPPRPVEKGPWKGHQAGIKALRFVKNLQGEFAVSAAGGGLLNPDNGKIGLAPDNSVRFWRPADGSEAKVVDLFKDGIAVAALSPDGRYVAVADAVHTTTDSLAKGSADHVIHVWDLQTKKEMPPLRGHTQDVYCLAFKKNGTHLLSGGRDNKMFLWKISDGSHKDPFLGHIGAVTGVAFDPKNERAVSCSTDKTIRLWDLDADPNANTLLYEFKGHQDIVWAVAFSDDGKYLLTAGGPQPGPTGYGPGPKDTDIRLWDVENIKDIKEVKRFKGTGNAVTCLAFSRDGRRVLSGGADNLVRLWYVPTGQELAKFEGHTDTVRGVAFFPDGKRALSGGDDKTLRVWNLPPDVSDLLANLASSDVKVKQQAVQELAKFGNEAKPAVPALLKCLSAGDAAFKQQVIALLKQLGGAPGRDDAALLATLAADKTFPEGRLFALDALATLGADAKPALPALEAMLKENDVVLKRKAIAVIGQIGPDARTAVYKQFIEFLRDPDAETVKAAGAALPKLGKPTKEQLGTLGGFLSDSNLNVRQYALTALGEMGPDAEPELPRLVQVATQDKTPELRKAALAAVVKLKPKDQATVDLLKAALKDEDNGVCLEAVAALAEIGPGGGALPGLLAALDHKNEEVRKAADDALGKAMFDKSHVKALATVLRLNRSTRVRAKIVDVLAKLGPDAADAAEDLGRVARDSEGELRLKAIATLGELGPAGKKGGAALVEVLADKNEKNDNVRIEVAIALTKMQAPEAKQAIPLLIRGLKVTDATDAKQTERQDKVAKILIQMGKPAADALAKTLDPVGDFYNSKTTTPAGMVASAARRKVIETLRAMGPNAKTGLVLQQLAKTSREDPDGEVRKLAKEVFVEIQK